MRFMALLTGLLVTVASPAFAGDCWKYAAKDGSTLAFVASDTQSAEQAVLLRLTKGQRSGFCVYSPGDEYGGTFQCPTLKISEETSDPDGIITLGGIVFTRDCSLDTGL